MHTADRFVLFNDRSISCPVSLATSALVDGKHCKTTVVQTNRDLNYDT